MSVFSRIQARLALAIGLTALIPVVAAVVLAQSMVRQSSERFFVPEIRQNLDQGLEAYRLLAKEVKRRMRQEARTLALDPALVEGARAGHWDVVARRLEQLREQYTQAAELTVVDEDDVELASARRAAPLNDKTDLPLPTDNALGSDGLRLRVLFVAPRAEFERFQAIGEFIDAYDVLMERRRSDESTYVIAFAVLLGFTIIGAISVGSALARGVVTRVAQLAEATQRAAGGDLTVRVEDPRPDELGQLARGFNRMLGEIGESRERIEYLSRLASWQEMARRLAHEIKNPLTPIQLAVQEVHERLRGQPHGQQELLDSTREIVESEVAALRRLVGEFSDFARLPESALEPVDLFKLLREIEAQAEKFPEVFGLPGLPQKVAVEFQVPDGSAPVAVDPQMFKRVLTNLIENAAHSSATGNAPARVCVSGSRLPSGFAVVVEDSGEGIDPELRQRVFEPYFTTKLSGTGLGLAIAKKIVIEHGGSIAAERSERLGGAEFRITLPPRSVAPRGADGSARPGA